ncbi:hypothetical protein MDA_GLEAN10022432 [Myotis davidii]|uniref:Uncharacterized protein n=1 Tax=Myotis davidii TaxID=225400 RepID=L5MCG3_MYODS|nr:hypothetical protein MDA_GLEAN10022432 [Myotis davidii]
MPQASGQRKEPQFYRTPEVFCSSAAWRRELRCWKKWSELLESERGGPRTPLESRFGRTYSCKELVELDAVQIASSAVQDTPVTSRARRMRSAQAGRTGAAELAPADGVPGCCRSLPSNRGLHWPRLASTERAA